MPRVNTLLLVGVLLLVALFRSSSALASAYGIAVTGTMVVTAMMAIVVIWQRLALAAGAAALALIVPFLLIDLTFLGANLLKVVEGGWMPLALGALVMIGDVHLAARQPAAVREDPQAARCRSTPLVASLEKKPPQRVPGTAVFLTSDPTCAPTALMHSLKHYKVLHEKNVILTIETADTPRVDPAERVQHRAGRRDILARACCASASWRRRTCRRRWRSRASSAGSSTSCRRRSSCRGARSSRPPVRHAALAGPAVHRAGAQRQRRHRLFPDSDRSRGRGRNAGHHLTVTV